MPRTPKVMTDTPTQPTGNKKVLSLVVVLTTLLLVAVVAAGYFYYQYKNNRPGVAEAKEIEALTTTLGAMMMLPEGETPTLATVTDREKLAEQPFFQKAENGDKVLIYSGSGRAILYRPSLGKIIDVTTVNVNTAQTETPAPAEPTTPTEAVPVIVRATLYNGSTTAGLTNGIEAQLKQAFTNVAVVTKENAKKTDYTETLVVDLTGSNATVAGDIAKALNGKVSSLPAGETAPADSDILIVAAAIPGE